MYGPYPFTGPRVRRLLKKVIPAKLRAALADLRSLTPSQRIPYLRARVSPGRFGRLPKGLRPGARIIFVCYGNIFRSPMAAALFATELQRRGLPDAGVSSAGLSAKDGREAHANGVRAAEAMGVSLASHRARLLTPELVARTDLIVVMDALNVAVMSERFPDALGRTVLLGAFDPDARRAGPIIDDPYGRPQDEVTGCYQRIERSARGLADRLASLSAGDR
jgi:protein-tyrosine phosphatase